MSRSLTRRSARSSALLIAAVALAPGLAACGDDSTDTAGAGGGALRIVATTTQAADFSRAIGGSNTTVTQILQPNVDPHDYELSPADIDAIADADVLVSNGVGLETWLDDAVSAAGFDGTSVVMADGVALREGSHGHEGEGEAASEEHAGEGEHAEEHAEEEEHDPHIWQNPRNAKIMIANIEKGLVAADPDDAADYRANLEAYDRKLDALDAAITTKIDSIPADRRKLVTNHDAFGYYADQYGLAVVGSIIPSFDTSAELSGQAIDDIVNKIEQEKVPAIFSESSLPPRTAETIGRESGVTVIAGEGALYADSLGPQGSPGATYVDAEMHNTDVIVDALR
jgi:ABC-type Zn uptake system ZnuABC Zn-binding protein ZnuA